MYDPTAISDVTTAGTFAICISHLVSCQYSVSINHE